MRAARLAVVLSALGLSGCGMAPLNTARSPIEAAGDPAYEMNERGTIVPSACRAAPRGGFGGLPPGCARDLTIASQAARASDLVHPRQAGPPSLGPAARAADAYLTAEPDRIGSGDAGGGAQVSRPAPAVPVVAGGADSMSAD